MIKEHTHLSKVPDSSEDHRLYSSKYVFSRQHEIKQPSSSSLSSSSHQIKWQNDYEEFERIKNWKERVLDECMYSFETKLINQPECKPLYFQ